MSSEAEPLSERMLDLEIKLAFQDRQVRQLDALVRELAGRLEKSERELAQLKDALRSPEEGVGPASETPPHY